MSHGLIRTNSGFFQVDKKIIPEGANSGEISFY